MSNKEIKELDIILRGALSMTCAFKDDHALSDLTHAVKSAAALIVEQRMTIARLRREAQEARGAK